MKIKYYIPILLLILQSALISQSTYIWTGSVNSNFSTAGNWNPTRQISRATDRLIFNNGQNNNITGVNQITFAQIIITGNTQVILNPGAGNARIIFIQSLTDNNSGGDENNLSPAALKYNEYNIEESTEDIATLKYKEYGLNTEEKNSNIADIKYREYENAPVNGMGDAKYEEYTDNPYDNNMFVEAGSILKINANDPSLSIFLKSNTRAEIYGSLIMQGSIQNSINSEDPYSIYFMDGSRTVQDCPGHLFNTTGALNSVIYKSGSILEINNSAALNPFALQVPNSKVMFESGSKFRLNSPNSNALRLSGRHYSNLEINTTLNYSEIITNDCSINGLIIKPGASLTINNLNNSSVIPNLNIKGNLQLDGALNFPENSSRNINIKLNGVNAQNISGNGNINLNTSLNNIIISNDININRNLEANCNVILSSGSINCSNNTFTIYGNFISPSALPVGVTIHPLLSSLPRNDGTAKLDDKKEDQLSPNTETKLVNESMSSGNIIPIDYYLNQNYPNPFNPSTTIEFGLPVESNVTLKVYNTAGMEITSLAGGSYAAGKIKLVFDGSNFSSGVYFYKITFNSGSNTVSYVKKMVLTK